MTIRWEAYGKFALRKPAEDVLSAWFQSQAWRNGYEEREARKWAQSVVLCQANDVELFEKTWSGYMLLDRCEQLMQVFAKSAQDGEGFVQAYDGDDVRALIWEVKAGKMISRERKAPATQPPCFVPFGTLAEVHQKQVLEEHANEEERRSTEERFQELLSRVASSAAPVTLTGGSERDRLRAAEQVHTASGRSQPFVVLVREAGKLGFSKIAPGATLYIDEPAELSVEEQHELLKHWAEHDWRLVVGSAQPLGRAVIENRLIDPLYFRLSVVVWNVEGKTRFSSRPPPR